MNLPELKNNDNYKSFLVRLSFPRVEIEIPSNRFYEKLFNRLAWDLAMWEPSTNLSPQAVEPPKKVFFELDEDAPETGIQFGAGKTTPMALGKFFKQFFQRNF